MSKVKKEKKPKKEKKVKHKYGKPTYIKYAGFTFRSQPEVLEFQKLELKQEAGEIRELKGSPTYPMVINTAKIKYIADISFISNHDSKLYVVEIKNYVTAKEKYYRLKNKIFLGLYVGIVFVEIIYKKEKGVYVSEVNRRIET